DLFISAKDLFVPAMVTTDGRQELRRRLICCLVVQLDGMREIIRRKRPQRLSHGRLRKLTGKFSASCGQFFLVLRRYHALLAPRLRAKDSQRRSISLRQHANLPCTRRRIGSTRLAGFLAFLVALALVRDLFLCAKHLFLAAIGGGWPWWSVALPCRRACARSRPDGGGSAGGCCRRSRLHSIGVRGPGRRGMGGCQPGPLAERIGNVELNPLRSALLCRPYVGPNASLVAQDPVRD